MYNTVIMGFYFMGNSMSEVNERLARVEQGQLHQEKQLDKLVSVTEKLADVHLRFVNQDKRADQHEKRLDKLEEKVSQNTKQIAKYALICTVGFGMLATYFPELKAVIGL